MIQSLPHSYLQTVHCHPGCLLRDSLGADLVLNLYINIFLREEWFKTCPTRENLTHKNQLTPINSDTDNGEKVVDHIAAVVAM